MTQKLMLVMLIFSWALVIGTAGNANASLLTDADGVDVGLFEDGGTENLFGPVGSSVGPGNLAVGYMPGGGFGSTLPVVVPDATQMEVTFLADSIFIRQFLASTGPDGPFTITNGWNMIVQDIEWPDGSTIVGASISESTFLSLFTVGFTANSVNVLYGGNDRIEIDQQWQATLNLVVQRPSIATPTPGIGLILLLGGIGIFWLKRVRVGT